MPTRPEPYISPRHGEVTPASCYKHHQCRHEDCCAAAAEARRKWHEKNPEGKRRHWDASQSSHEYVNDLTRLLAQKARQPWTAGEDEAVLNDPRPMREIALELGRSYYACNHRRYTLMKAERDGQEEGRESGSREERRAS
jgi:hypothetical protein